MKKLTKADILSIKPGKIEVFVFETAKAIMSALLYAWLIGRAETPEGVARYKTKANFENKTLVIEAVPVEK